MRFQKRNKLGEGGKRRGAGRPSKAQLAERESLRQAIEREREERAGVLAARYVEMAQEDPATMRHLVDKVMPDEPAEWAQQPPQITFINFADIRPSQLAKDITITPLASNGKVASPSLPMPTAGEQTKLAIGGAKTEPPDNLPKPQVKFHAFSSGNGKRQE